MAKGRIINKSISTSRRVNLMLRNPLDILLYTFGIIHADDEGRIDGDPIIFRGKVAPILPGLTDARTSLAIDSMKEAKLVCHYQVDGVWVLQFLDWEEHQTFKGYHQKQSKLPAPPKQVISTLSGENHPITPPISKVTYTKVKESKTNKDTPHTSSKTQNTEESTLKTNIGFPDFKETVFRKWNALAEKEKLTSIVSISKSREEKLRTRWNEGIIIEHFDKILSEVSHSTLLCGRLEKPSPGHEDWKVTFDWLIDNDKNYLKVLEGNYRDKLTGSNKKPDGDY